MELGVFMSRTPEIVFFAERCLQDRRICLNDARW
jgi:hypothetical protein